MIYTVMILMQFDFSTIRTIDFWSRYLVGIRLVGLLSRKHLSRFPKGGHIIDG